MTSSNRGPKGSHNATKAKIARRVVEVLDYFDNDHPEASVMDIARRFDRPQSSTSELLSSLVDLGLLVKDARSRSYKLAPRAALLGTGGQAPVVRSGELGRLIDRLVARTGLSVAVFGIVRLNTQISIWRSGTRCDPRAVRELKGGNQEPLSISMAGWLLLSTIARERREGILHRLNSEASDGNKFSVPQMVTKLEQISERDIMSGAAGFGSRAKVVAALVPHEIIEQPMVIGIVYGDRDRVDVEVLRDTLENGMLQLRMTEDGEEYRQAFSSAA